MLINAHLSRLDYHFQSGVSVLATHVDSCLTNDASGFLGHLIHLIIRSFLIQMEQDQMVYLTIDSKSHCVRVD